MKKEHIKNLSLNKIKPYDRNPRKNDKAVDYVCKSIEKNGYIAPILTDDSFCILAGHTRFKALKKLNRKECDIIKITGLTEKQKKDYRIMDNKSSELALWDFEALQVDFKPIELEEFGFDLQADFGIEPEPDKQADVIPEIDKKKVICKTGDLWQLGKHRLLCGDSTKESDVLLLMDGKKADMVFTDPPYGINLDTDFSKIMNRGKKYKKIKNDDKNYNPKYIFDFFDYCKEIFLWGADYFSELIPKRNDGCFFVWDKQISEHDGKSHTGSLFELCWSKNKHKREIIKCPYFRFYGMDTKKRLHPTQKPVNLCEWFINKFSKEKNIIADLFLGSGSTLIACEKTDRICNGIEIDNYYCDVILQRWADYTNKDPIRIKDNKKFSELKI